MPTVGFDSVLFRYSLYPFQCIVENLNSGFPSRPFGLGDPWQIFYISFYFLLCTERIFVRNIRRYITRVVTIETRVVSKLKRYKKRPIVIAHPAPTIKLNAECRNKLINLLVRYCTFHESSLFQVAVRYYYLVQ